MTNFDERIFSQALSSTFPKMVFLDGKSWSNPEPVTADSIEHCNSKYNDVYLWNKELFPEIPVTLRADGKYHGPASGPVLQFLRCIPEENVLRSGRIVRGFNDEDITPEIEVYINAVWKILKQPATSALVCVSPMSGEIINPKVSSYWVWPDAVRWCRAEAGRFLRDRATQNYYRLA